jgi:hypothetical protein
MDPTTRPAGELAQQAPLVPDIGRDAARTDGGRATAGEIRTTSRTRNLAIQRTYDDELAQEAPLVPDLGRPGARQTTTDPTQ